MTIVGEPGCTLIWRGGEGAPCIRITGPDVTLRNIRFAHESTTSPSVTPFIEITGPRAVVENCTFETTFAVDVDGAEDWVVRHCRQVGVGGLADYFVRAGNGAIWGVCVGNHGGGTGYAVNAVDWDVTVTLSSCSSNVVAGGNIQLFNSLGQGNSPFTALSDAGNVAAAIVVL